MVFYKNRTLKNELIPLKTDIIEPAVPVSEFSLQQNYPNPFNPVTNISFRIPESGNITLKVYDVLGREVLTLVNEVKRSGSYTVLFNPGLYNLSTGIYIYELKHKGMHLSRKMVYLK